MLWALPPECAAVLLGGPACKHTQADPLIHAYFATEVASRPRLFPAFDAAFYTRGAPCSAGEDAFAHFIVHADTDAPDPHPLVKLSYVQGETGETPVLERLADLIAGRVTGSTHPLLDVAFVRTQAGGERLTLGRMLEFFGGSEEPLPLAPHPLFQPAFYREANGVHGVNELLHYLGSGRGALQPHPLFSPPFVAAALPRRLEARETLLEAFLRAWPKTPIDPCIFVDLRHLNHLLETRLGAPVGDRHPLALALAELDALSTGDLHAECDARIIAFIFGSEPADALETLQEGLGVLTAAGAASLPLDDEAPMVSVVMPTFHKACYTALSVMAASRALSTTPHEIIVVENGGDALRHEALRRLFARTPTVRFVKLPENRFFGEASNIGADLARGEHILFLNNDCFLAPDFGERLKELLSSEAPQPEALGAALLFPNGSLQELGGIVGDDGQVIQLGKHLPVSFLDDQPPLRTADYASAACLLLSRRALDRVIGFDPVFEPFYFEDVDLCRRLHLARTPLHVSARLRAMHVENASTREFLGEGMHPLVSRNRETFARRWMREKGGDALIKPEPSTPALVHDQPLALIATPFDVVPGGGERYLLRAAQTLSRTHRVVIASARPISRARVEFVRHALGVEAFPFEIGRVDDLGRGGRTFDTTFVVGNEIAPFLPPLGRRNLFHLQFPFPWRHLRDLTFEWLDGYDSIVVNSRFTAEWTRRRLEDAGLGAAPPVVVVAPPVSPVDHGGPRAAGPLRIANVGRFFTLGHCKRQDVVLDVVEALRRAGVQVTATLAGSIAPAPGAQAFFDQVTSRAKIMGGVEVVRDASRRTIEAVLQQAHVYLHPCGFGVDGSLYPETLEHFGIAVAEAISAGCHPVVVDQGGPKLILETQGFGDTFSTVAGAVQAITAWSRTDITTGAPGWRGQPLDESFDAWIAAFLQTDRPSVKWVAAE